MSTHRTRIEVGFVQVSHTGFRYERISRTTHLGSVAAVALVPTTRLSSPFSSEGLDMSCIHVDMSPCIHVDMYNSPTCKNVVSANC